MTKYAVYFIITTMRFIKTSETQVLVMKVVIIFSIIPTFITFIYFGRFQL